MMNRRTCLAAGLLGVAGSAQAQTAGTLRFALGQTWGPPFVERQGLQIKGGLLPELMTAIAAELGRKPEMLLLPPTRVERAIDEGTVDLHCLMSPNWWPAIRDPARWSVPLLRLRDVLVAGPGGPISMQAVSRQTWTVGTVRGYVYPTLDAAFQQGRLRREEALDQWAVLQKLGRGRTPLGIVNEFVLRAWQRRHPVNRLSVVQVVDEVDAHCLLAARPQLPPAQLQQAIRRLVSSGRLQRVIEPYLGGSKELPR